MPWNWEQLLQKLPEDKRIHYESLHIQADMLGALPTVERKAMRVPARQLEAVLLRAFEETFVDFHMKYFETRFKRLKTQCGDAFDSYSVYFPGTNLYISNGETGDFICHFRVPTRNTGYREEGFFGA